MENRLDRTIERLGPAWEAFDQDDPSESGEPFWLRMRELELSRQCDDEEVREDRTHHLALKAYQDSELLRVVVDCHGEER